MADYKDYIVRYDIQANVAEAVSGLNTLAENINKNLVPLKAFSKYLKSATENAKILKANSKIDFTINLTGFQAELDKMIAMANSAAAEMQQAIYRGLTASGAGKKSAQRGAVSAFTGQSIKEVKAAIQDYQKEYDKLMGTPTGKNGQRKRDGLIQMAKNANQKELVEQRQKRAAFLKDLKADGERYIKQQEAFEKRVLSGPTTQSKIRKVNNVSAGTAWTPAAIKALKDNFPKSKVISLTLNLQDNATATLTKIDEKIRSHAIPELSVAVKLQTSTIQEQLNKVTPKPRILVDAQIRGNGIQKQLNKLTGTKENKNATKSSVSTTSQNSVPPAHYFTTQDQSERNSLLSKNSLNKTEQKRLDNLNRDRILSGVNKTLSKKELDNALRWQKTLDEHTKIQGTPTRQQIYRANQAVKGLAKLGWKENITPSPSQAIIGSASKVPKIDQSPYVSLGGKKAEVLLTLNPTPALETFYSVLAQIKATSASINLTANSTTTTPLSTKIPGGALPKASNKGTTGHQAKYIPNTSEEQFGYRPGPSTPYYWRPEIGSHQRSSELMGMRKDARSAFSKLTQFEQQEQEAQNRKIQSQNRLAQMRRENRLNSLRAKLHNAMLPFASNQEQLNSLMKYRKYLFGGSQYQSMNTAEKLNYLNSVSNRLSRRGIAIPNALVKEIAKVKEEHARFIQTQQDAIKRGQILNDKARESMRIAPSAMAPLNTTQRAVMINEAHDAFRNLTPYEKQLTKEQERTLRQQEKIQKDQIKRDQQRIQSRQKSNLSRLQTLRNNAVAPYVTNASQMQLASANLPYFNAALQKLGLSPSTQLWGNSAFLKEVQRQMIAGNVKVPSYLPSAIAQAEKAEAKALNQITKSSKSSRMFYGGGRGREGIYDRSRRWAYPFTGNTSFGARTPMAVDMAKGMGVMFAIGGAMSAISNSFSQAMEYQNTMETTKAILQNGTDNYSSTSFEKMQKTIRNVGVKTKFSAPEVASAARFLAMAGYDIESINNAIRPIADLALMGDYDLGETADKMTNIMTTFGVDAKKMKEDPNIMRKYGNIMAAVATRSNTDVMMLAESAKYGGGVANMYGREDPNNFADTMAIFGVMGNAGIQGSSAGTALRMMYQNIFNPNKKQMALLSRLESEYGITTKKSDGSRRSMSDILIDMANRIPQKEQADIISKLFRITAQPGANAAILAASQSDGSNAEEVYNALKSIDTLLDKQGLGALTQLMIAAREAVHGDSLGAIANKKQNTIQGLWAQVTSTFTEGIVKAFEERKGGITEMLQKLRDYFSKPETITMMKNLLDMIIEIGKVMAWFVKIWANLYNFAPGVIKFWVVMQMAFTQMGALIAPIISLVGVLDRLGFSFGRLAMAGNATTASIGRTTAAGVARATSKGISGPIATPFIVGRGRIAGSDRRGWSVGTYQTKVTGASAVRANRMVKDMNRQNLITDAILAGSMFMPMPSSKNPESFRMMKNAGTPLLPVNGTTQSIVQNRYAEVRARANRIYGWGRVSRGFTTALNAGLTTAAIAPFFGGFKSMFFGLMTGLSKALGLLINPVTLAVAGIGALTYGVSKLHQKISGTTEGQIKAREIMSDAISQSIEIREKEREWFRELQDIYLPQNLPQNVLLQTITPTTIEEFDAAEQAFKEKYAPFFNKGGENASDQATQELGDRWVKDILNSSDRFGFSPYQIELLENGAVTNWSSKKYITPIYNEDGVASLQFRNTNAGAVSFANSIAKWLNLKNNEEETIKNLLPIAIQQEGIHSQETKDAIQHLMDTYINEVATGLKQYSQWEKESYAYARKVANLEERTWSSEGIDLDEFYANRDNFSKYSAYGLGIYNTLTSIIRQDYGSLLSRYLAQNKIDKKIRLNELEELNSLNNLTPDLLSEYQQLQQYISKIGAKEWNEVISLYLEQKDFQVRVYDNAKKLETTAQLKIQTFPGGKINFDGIIEQLKSQYDDFTLTLNQFADGIGGIYKWFEEIGVLKPGGAWHKLRENLDELPLNSKTLEDFYKNLLIYDPTDQFFIPEFGSDVKKFVDAVLNGENRAVLQKEVKNMITNQRLGMPTVTFALPAGATPIKNPNNPQINGATSESGSEVVASANNPSIPTPPSQQEYASHYDKGMIKPTQVNMNWTVNFDHTKIDGSATERDMAKQIEENLVAVIYQAVAAAANQAQLQGTFA